MANVMLQILDWCFFGMFGMRSDVPEFKVRIFASDFELE